MTFSLHQIRFLNSEILPILDLQKTVQVTPTAGRILHRNGPPELTPLYAAVSALLHIGICSADHNEVPSLLTQNHRMF